MNELKDEPSEAEGAEKLSVLKRKSVRGGGVAILAQGITVCLQMGSTVVLARLLSPNDYGILGMVMSFTAFAGLFKDLGLSSAAIQNKDLTQAQQSNLFWLNTCFGLLLTILVIAGAPVVSWFYGREELLGMTMILALNFMLTSLSAQHNAMLVRRMHFGRQAVANIAGILVTFLITFIMAWKGWGSWSLAWGMVAGEAVRTVIIWSLSPFMPGSWSKGVGTRKFVGFGANVTAFNFVNYFGRNLDKILIGKFAGTASLGEYSRAYQLLMFPVSNLRRPIEQVVFPAMSQLQDNPDAWKSYYLNTIRLLAMLTMPLAVWLLLVSKPLVLVLLGDQWAGIIPLFQVLALVCFIQPCFSLVGTVMLSFGRSKHYFRQGAAVSVVTSIGFAVGALWSGAVGVAWSYVVTSYLVLIPCLLYTYRGTPLQVRDFFKCIFFPAFLSLVVGLLVFIIRGNFNFKTHWWELYALSFLFVFGSLITMLILPQGRRLLVEGQLLAKGFLGRD